MQTVIPDKRLEEGRNTGVIREIESQRRKARMKETRKLLFFLKQGNL